MTFFNKTFWNISNKLSSGDAFEQVVAGFTIIELMVTISIIIMMTVLAIPAFSNYEKNVQWENKIEEISRLINEAELRVRNPEVGVSEGYALTVGSSIQLKKDNEVLKSVVLPAKYGVENIITPTVTHYFDLVCPTAEGICCLKKSPFNAYSCKDVANQTSEQGFFRLYFNDKQVKAEFYLKTSPFKLRVDESGQI